MKAIAKFYQTLKESGVPNPQSFLSLEEQHLVEDYEFLKKKGFEQDLKL